MIGLTKNVDRKLCLLRWMMYQATHLIGQFRINNRCKKWVILYFLLMVLIKFISENRIVDLKQKKSSYQQGSTYIFLHRIKSQCFGNVYKAEK